jgi:hypothetical protein
MTTEKGNNVMPHDGSDQPRAGVRARWAAGPAATRRSGVGPPRLGVVLAEVRGERCLSVSALARRAAVDRRTVQRIERAARRPRPSMLWALAWGLDPDDVDELYGRLVAAAVPVVQPDTPASRRARARRMDAGWRAGDVPMPIGIERRARLSAASWAMISARHALAGLMAGPLTVAEFGTVRGLLTVLAGEERALFAEAGNFAHGVPLPRRQLGDRPDVPVVPPEGTGLAGLGRWVREWQVREGRRPPRTARERAISATGAAERARVAAHPATGPRIRLRWLPDDGHSGGALPGR